MPPDPSHEPERLVLDNVVWEADWALYSGNWAASWPVETQIREVAWSIARKAFTAGMRYEVACITDQTELTMDDLGIDDLAFVEAPF